ncbi:MAG: hypothetical protein ABSG86_15340 [Thermoguttaceae bacterium]|jgi:hypothetical protein
MSSELETALLALIRRLASIAIGDAELIAELRRLAQQFLKLTEPPAVEEPGPAEQAVEAAAAQELPAEPVFSELPPPRHEPLPTAPGIEVPIGWVRRLGVSDADLQRIENRCRLKAEGARWAATRERRLGEGADYALEIEPADRDIIARAKALEDCFLWMNHPSGPTPHDLSLWEDVAGCFDAVALVLSLLRQLVGDVEKNRGLFEQTLDLVAESQSALRMAVDAVGGRPDSDQDKVFNWLRRTAAEQQIFVRRFMRLDDPADPANWHGLQERIGAVDAQIEGLRKQEKQRANMLGKGKYHARRIVEGQGSEEDWKKVLAAVESLVNDGMPPSNSVLRDMLAPLVDDMPDALETPPGFQRVLAEIDRFLATQAAPSAEVSREISAEVQEVAGLLENKVVVLIGGERRPHAHEAFKSAFKLKEMVWISTREHESVDQFESYVARADVAAVLLAIRWSSHSYGEVRDYCLKHGKLFVRLPGGYNPNQVAHQILLQTGGSGA